MAGSGGRLGRYCVPTCDSPPSSSGLGPVNWRDVTPVLAMAYSKVRPAAPLLRPRRTVAACAVARRVFSRAWRASWAGLPSWVRRWAAMRQRRRHDSEPLPRRPQLLNRGPDRGPPRRGPAYWRSRRRACQRGHLRRGAVMVHLVLHKVHCRLPGSFFGREAHQWLTRMALSAGRGFRVRRGRPAPRTAARARWPGRCAPILGGPDVRVGEDAPLQRPGEKKYIKK